MARDVHENDAYVRGHEDVFLSGCVHIHEDDFLRCAHVPVHADIPYHDHDSHAQHPESQQSHRHPARIF